MYEKDVVNVARENGWFKGKDKDFDFQKAYNPYDFSGLRACEARVWSFFRTFDKNMDKYKKHIMGDASEEPMPLYIIPDRKVSLADVREGMPQSLRRHRALDDERPRGWCLQGPLPLASYDLQERRP